MPVSVFGNRTTAAGCQRFGDPALREKRKGDSHLEYCQFIQTRWLTPRPGRDSFPANMRATVARISNRRRIRLAGRRGRVAARRAPAGVVQPQYDEAGNMTAKPRPGAWDSGLACTWDAWNRLVSVRSSTGSSSSSDSSSSESSSSGSSSSESSSSESSSSGSASSGSSSESSSSSRSSCVDESYQYDALTRRIVTETAAETRHYYFNSQWRAIEERVSGAVKAQYVWNPADRWDLIRRKRSVAGTLDEIRFVLRDYLDPAAIINESGTVTERYRYDAFGPVTVLAPDFSVRATSECAWNFLYHAEFIDALTGLYNYGYRYYHPDLGRWISRDPIGEQGGVNLYGFLGNNGVGKWDILGLMELREGEPRYREPDHAELKCKCSITVDVAHGGIENTGSTHRMKARLKGHGGKVNRCHKYISAGCGANYLNKKYQGGGIGIPDANNPKIPYPTNNAIPEDPVDLKKLKDNGRDENDYCPANQLFPHVDQAIESSKAFVPQLCAQCECDVVKLRISCTGGETDPMDIHKMEEHQQTLTGRKPSCNTTVEIPCPKN